MKNSKKSAQSGKCPLNSKPRPVYPPSLEWKGHCTARNYWYRIGLSPIELAAVKKAKECIFVDPAHRTTAETLRAVMMAGLAHFEALEPKMRQDAGYARSEGFLTTEHYVENVMMRVFGLENLGVDKWI